MQFFSVRSVVLRGFRLNCGTRVRSFAEESLQYFNRVEKLGQRNNAARSGHGEFEFIRDRVAEIVVDRLEVCSFVFAC